MKERGLPVTDKRASAGPTQQRVGASLNQWRRGRAPGNHQIHAGTGGEGEMLMWEIER